MLSKNAVWDLDTKCVPTLGGPAFANKNLTTGEGSMVVTNDKTLATAARYHKNLCFPLDAQRTCLHNDIGFNYRISNLHAMIDLAQVE